jgi:Trk K+ transport system NAD-binding subunit
MGEGMTGHYIVCGMGHVGYRVVDLLRRLGEEVVIVTLPTREEWLRAAQEAGASVIMGDARDESVLEKAGIATAGALLAMADKDLVNVEISLDAKRLRPELPVVVRIFDQNLAQQLEASFDVRRALAMSALAAPTFVAAALGEEVAGSFRMEDSLFVVGQCRVGKCGIHEGASVREVAARHSLAVLSVQRERGAEISPPPDTALEEEDRVTLLGDHSDWLRVTGSGESSPEPAPALRARRTISALSPAVWLRFAHHVWSSAPLPLRIVFAALNALIVISVFVFHLAMDLSLIDAIYFIVATVTTTGYGDISPIRAHPWLRLYSCLVMLLGSATIATLYSIITDYIVATRFRQLLGRHRTPHSDHFVVAGLGTVGYRIVDKLKRVGARVVAIERNPNGEFVEDVRSHTEVIVGDARLGDTLAKAGVEKARAVLAVTGDDAANLSVALETERRNSAVRTVVRLFDQEFARKVKQSLGVDAAMGAFGIAAHAFVAAAMYRDVRTAFLLDDRLYAVLFRRCGDEWHGLRPSFLRDRDGIAVMMRRPSNRQPFLPACDDTPLDESETVLAVVWKSLVR